MNRLNKVVSSSLLALTLLGGTSVSAAGFATDGLHANGDSLQILTNVSTYAGLGDFGDKNDTVQLSLFRSPQGVVALSDGSVLVTDTKSQMIRKITNGAVSTFAGVTVEKDKFGFPIGGLMDGVKDQSFFNHPAGIAADKQGNLYVADADNHAVRKISVDGKVTTIAGNGVPGNVNGTGGIAGAARFNHPMDVAVSTNGTIYVADTLNNLIRKITTDGTVSTLNAASTRTIQQGQGNTVSVGDFLDGALAEAKFNEPSGLAIDAQGNLYVSDSGNQRIRYIDFTTGKVTTVAGNTYSAAAQSVYEANALYGTGDFADGNAEQAKFNFPLGITVTAEGGLLIADSMNHSVRYLYQGKVSTIAGDRDQFPGALNGIERTAKLNVPSDVTVMSDGTVLVADAHNNKIRKISLYSLPAEQSKDDSIKVVLNSTPIVFDTKPEIVSDRTMVPVRAIAEGLGYEVTYVPDGEIIRLSKGDVTIEMAVGNKEVKKIEKGKADEVVAIDVAPLVNQDNRTLLPVRFFAQEIGLDVQWNEVHQTVILRTPEAQ